MAQVTRISSGMPWEPVVGYSRAVKAGNLVFVSGTTSTDERGAIVAVNQMYAQARQAIENIGTALARLGLSLRDVVRTRMFTTDISRYEEIARAHREAFGENPPASTLVAVQRFVHPDMLVEIEAIAYAGESGKDPATEHTAASRVARVSTLAKKVTARASKRPKAKTRKPTKKPPRSSRARPR
jgi:enamine deaminase RidA (YjgF/YER057c/UK114 family)